MRSYLDGECSDYGGNPCSICDAAREWNIRHIQFIASVKENRRLDLVFPDYQGARANDLEVVTVHDT